MTPPQVGHLLEELTEIRETHLLVYYIINNIDKKSDEAIYRVKSGRLPGTETSVPLEVKYTTLQVYICVHQCRISLKPVFLVFL